ncbi:uncharacterized protein G2W53_039749 [Senna tora]|uniref:Uncharacterized protein n=1 Tax=Senna tora TaxID=362788 RepID=A0A834W3U5_9FABA|nr:uncharacterized protein G2W53_039749 [Senna tora]
MRQTKVEIPRPSSTNSKDSDDNMNLPIALRKGGAIRAWRREKGIGLAGWDSCVSLSSKYGQPLVEDLTPLLLVS